MRIQDSWECKKEHKSLGGEIHVKKEPLLVVLAVQFNLFTLDSNERKLGQLQTSLL